MEEKKTNEKKKELSAEQIKQIITQLQQQNQQLKNQLQAIDTVAIRLNFLFKVLEQKEVFELGFVSACVAEVQELLTIPKEEDKKEAEKNTEQEEK